ncbi:MAG: NAD(P)/FAD-dependent oxidoreductase [Sphingomonadaceae bacterium]
MDCIIIGGGIVGTCCALRLQQAGIKTVIVDPAAEPKPPSWGNAGHIAIEQVEPLASRAMIRSAPGRLFALGGALSLPLSEIAAWAPFAAQLWKASAPERYAMGRAALGVLQVDALPAWRRLTADMKVPDLLVENGHFVVWESARTAAAGLEHWSRADIGTARFRAASDEELQRLAAIMRAPPAGAIRFTNTAQIADPDQLLAALAALSGERRVGSAAALRMEDGQAAVELAGGEVLRARTILVAAGVRSGALMTGIGHKVPIIAERGYHIASPGGAWPQDLPPIVFEDRSVIVTRFAGSVRASSFVELARAESPPDARKWARLRKHVRALGLPFEPPGKQWMGPRPTLPDYLPAIGRSGIAPNLFYAFGHQHLGLTLAPTTAEHMLALMAGNPQPLLRAFDVERFA